MVMDAALYDRCGPLPAGSKLPIYPQITVEDLGSLLLMSSDGADAAAYLNVAPAPLLSALSGTASPPPRDASAPSPAAATGQTQPDDSEVFSDIVLGYINRMLMAEDIDEKFDHYPAHPALLAAEKPFFEILADQAPCSGRSTVESPDGSSVTTNSFNSLASCNCAAPSDGLGAMQPPPALEFPTPEFLHPPHFYQDLSPESCVVEAAGAWPPHDPMEFDPLPDALLSQSSSFASSNGSSVAFPEGFEPWLSTAGAVPDAGLSDFVLQSQQAVQFMKMVHENWFMKICLIHLAALPPD